MMRVVLLSLVLLVGSLELCVGDIPPDINKEGDVEQSDGSWFSNALEMKDLAQLSWEYIHDMQCWLWPDKCDQENQTHPDWSWPTVGWDSLQALADWYARVTDPTDGRINNNLTGLQWDLERRVHGQHLAVKLITTSLERFLQDDEPKMSLALSFHGWTGTGKNLAARIIAENLYQDGQRSLCIRVFIPQLHFPHLSLLEAYKVQLKKQIQEVSSRCRQPLFIFDEADKLPVPLLSSLLPFLNPSESQQDRRIFLFLSSFGSNVINEVALNFWNAGRQREEITLDDMDRPLRSAIKENQDILPQHLLREGIIDGFVPFLPLERVHVKLCARDFFVARGLPYTETALEEVTKDLLFVPTEEKIFSATGCKIIAQRVNFLDV
ncbi:torsin-3A isoform 2-T2 [Discoglossus pictus]